MQDVAGKIILKCGGHQKVADMLGLDVSQIYRWTYPKSRGGTGGIIPTKRQNKLLQVARNSGIEINPDDFFPAQTCLTKPSHKDTIRIVNNINA